MHAVMLALATLALAMAVLGSSVNAARNYSVGAFCYGCATPPPAIHAAIYLHRARSSLPTRMQPCRPWHKDPTNEKLHGKNWTEWRLVEHAQPRFPGHLQPNVGYSRALLR